MCRPPRRRAADGTWNSHSTAMGRPRAMMGNHAGQAFAETIKCAGRRSRIPGGSARPTPSDEVRARRGCLCARDAGDRRVFIQEGGVKLAVLSSAGKEAVVAML